MGNDERGHIALPKLYGGPAYARPPVVPVRPIDRPFDPDSLPIEAELTGEELEMVQQLMPRPYEGAAPSEPSATAMRDGRSFLRGRPFRLRVRVPGGRPKDGDGTAPHA